VQLRDLFPEFQRHGVGVVSVSVSGPEQAHLFSEAKSLPFPLLSDPDREIIRTYGVYHFLSLEAFRLARPSSFLIDRDGRIRFLYVGSNQLDRPAPEVLLAEVAKLSR
jgi:methyl-accepting chemotaxis protein